LGEWAIERTVKPILAIREIDFENLLFKVSGRILIRTLSLGNLVLSDRRRSRSARNQRRKKHFPTQL